MEDNQAVAATTLAAIQALQVTVGQSVQAAIQQKPAQASRPLPFAASPEKAMAS